VVDEDIYYRVFTLKNERDGTQDPTYELPETGGHGRSTYTLGGALLLMLATLLLYRSRMGRREGKENRACDA
jgi:LPXTG-motif cell wall-anchored protein